MPTKKPKTDAKPETTAPQPARIFDVARPGTMQPASSTTRPIIVTNRAVMQDPMVMPQNSTTVPEKEAESSARLGAKLVIAPLPNADGATADPTKLIIQHDDDADGLVDVKKTDEKFADDDASNDKTVPKRTPMDTVAVATAAFSGNAAAADSEDFSGSALATAEALDESETKSFASQAAATTESMDADPSQVAIIDKEAAQLEADARAQDEMDTLVEKKSYFLPINSVEKRRSKNIFIVGLLLIIVLVVAWLDIALDAGFITIDGIQPVTHLFRNQ